MTTKREEVTRKLAERRRIRELLLALTAPEPAKDEEIDTPRVDGTFKNLLLLYGSQCCQEGGVGETDERRQRRAAVLAAFNAEREARVEAGATKDMHKERAQEIELAWNLATQRADKAEQELAAVDERLSRRPALAEIVGRAAKIERAINVAAKADQLKRELAFERELSNNRWNALSDSDRHVRELLETIERVKALPRKAVKNDYGERGVAVMANALDAALAPVAEEGPDHNRNNIRCDIYAGGSCTCCTNAAEAPSPTCSVHGDGPAIPPEYDSSKQPERRVKQSEPIRGMYMRSPITSNGRVLHADERNQPDWSDVERCAFHSNPVPCRKCEGLTPLPHPANPSESPNSPREANERDPYAEACIEFRAAWLRYANSEIGAYQPAEFYSARNRCAALEAARAEGE